jgi:hypothetical protein
MNQLWTAGVEVEQRSIVGRANMYRPLNQAFLVHKPPVGGNRRLDEACVKIKDTWKFGPFAGEGNDTRVLTTFIRF